MVFGIRAFGAMFCGYVGIAPFVIPERCAAEMAREGLGLIFFRPRAWPMAFIPCRGFVNLSAANAWNRHFEFVDTNANVTATNLLGCKNSLLAFSTKTNITLTRAHNYTSHP